MNESDNLGPCDGPEDPRVDIEAILDFAVSDTSLRDRRKGRHRHAALQLATTVLIIGRLIAYRNRWSSS